MDHAQSGQDPVDDQIVPDTKDWTWVLREPCSECGFDPATVTSDVLGERIRNAAATVHGALHDEGATIRPDAATWSKLEYGAHVRDVCRTMLSRLQLLVTEDDPTFANWDQDETARAERYGEQHPERVAIELDLASGALAEAYDQVPEGAWERPGRRSNGSAFTTFTLGVYALHDLEHHAWDVTRGDAGSSLRSQIDR